MIYELLPLIVGIFWLGMSQLAQYQAEQNLPSSSITTVAQDAASEFIDYRNAVASYLAQNPGFAGSVPASGIAPFYPPGMVLPSAAGNMITATASGNGSIIYAWSQSLPVEAAAAVQMLGGDASIGMVSGSQWISPIYGVQNWPVPAFVPDGDILSIIQIGS